MSAAYSMPKHFREERVGERRAISVAKRRNPLYVSVPSKSAEILARRKNPPSQTLQRLRGNQWARVPVKGLDGPLRHEMENYNPFTDQQAVRKLKNLRQQHAKLRNQKAVRAEMGKPAKFTTRKTD